MYLESLQISVPTKKIYLDGHFFSWTHTKKAAMNSKSLMAAFS